MGNKPADVAAHPSGQNKRLVDFENIRQLVIMNIVRNVPSEMKNRCSCSDCLLSDFL